MRRGSNPTDSSTNTTMSQCSSLSFDSIDLQQQQQPFHFNSTGNTTTTTTSSSQNESRQAFGDSMREFDRITQSPVQTKNRKLGAVVQRRKSMQQLGRGRHSYNKSLNGASIVAGAATTALATRQRRDHNATYVTYFTPPPAPPPAVNGTKNTRRMSLQTQRRMSLQTGSSSSSSMVQQEQGHYVPTDAVRPTLASRETISRQRSIHTVQDCLAAYDQRTQAPSAKVNSNHTISKPTQPFVKSRCVSMDHSAAVPVATSTPTVVEKRHRRTSLEMSSTPAVAHQQQHTVAATTTAIKTVCGLDRSLSLRFATNEHLEHYFL